MIENPDPEEKPAGGAEIYPAPDTPDEPGAQFYPALEPAAEPILEGETAAPSGASVYTTSETGPQAITGEAAAVPAAAYSEPVQQGGPQPSAAPKALSPSEERTWAMLAHLSVLANLVTGVLGPFIALVIYLVYRDRSRYVAYQSMQAFIFQLITWVGSGILIGAMWLITGLLSVVVIGVFLIPFALIGTVCLGILPLVGLIYGIIGAIETNQGKDFRYWLVGDWVRGIY